MLERRFRRDLGSLGEIVGFVQEFLSLSGVDGEHAFDVELILEELFTNMVKYNRGHEDIAIALGFEKPVLTMRLRDFGVDRFDPTELAPVDVDRPVEERRAGGLGIHFVRTIADEVLYDYEDRNSTITVRKRLGN